jgi:hypothetical protein
MKRFGSVSLIYGLLVLTAGFMFASCVAALNPVAAAKTTEQKAFAIYGEFVVFEEAAAKIAKDPSTQLSVLQALRMADTKAKAVMDTTLNAALDVIEIERQIAVGQTTQDKLLIATTNLQSWVDQGTPLVNDLIKAVKGAKTSGS